MSEPFFEIANVNVWRGDVLTGNALGGFYGMKLRLSWPVVRPVK